MKHILVFILLSLSIYAGVNRGLVIGINNGSLTYAVNDAEAMAYLLEYRGVTQIVRLYNEYATKENIMKYLNSIVSNSNRGDRVYIFFSGHGTSYYDPAIQNNPRLKSMLKNSGGLIPWGVTPNNYERGMISAKYDLAPLFAELDRKGVKTVVVFDACFSGLAFKDVAFAKSTKAIPISAKPHYNSNQYPYRDIIYFSATTQSDFASESHRYKRGYFSMAITDCMGKYYDVNSIKRCISKAKIPQTPIILASSNQDIFPKNNNYKDIITIPSNHNPKERVFDLLQESRDFQIYTQDRSGILTQNYTPSTPLNLYIYSKREGYLVFLIYNKKSDTLIMAYPNIHKEPYIEKNSNKKLLELTPKAPFGEEILGAYLVEKKALNRLKKIGSKLDTPSKIDKVIKIIRESGVVGAKISLISREN